MVPVTAMWLPILLSAVIVFVASSIIHMVLPFHRKDYKPVPSEDGVMEALRRFNIPVGDYLMPCPTGPSAMKDPAFLEKRAKGPVLMMTVMPSGPVNMGTPLAQWFVYCVVVGIFAGYVAGAALPPGAPYLAVLRFVGTVAFVGYSLASWQNTIWYKRSWAITARTTIDGLIYGMLTAGTFGWLWPKA
jgi:hypothetical protein